MQAKQREKMRRIQMGEEVDVNDVEVSNDRFKPFNVEVECGDERQVMDCLLYTSPSPRDCS